MSRVLKPRKGQQLSRAPVITIEKAISRANELSSSLSSYSLYAKLSIPNRVPTFQLHAPRFQSYPTLLSADLIITPSYLSCLKLYIILATAEQS
jgi:hypothetical protein